MKTLTLSEDVGLQSILDEARGEDIVVKLADGSEFFIAAIDDFDRELAATRKNEKLMAFLDRRAAQEESIPLEEVKRRLGLNTNA